MTGIKFQNLIIMRSEDLIYGSYDEPNLTGIFCSDNA